MHALINSPLYYHLVVYPIIIEPKVDDDINLTQYSLMLDLVYNYVNDYEYTDLLNETDH